MFFECEFPRTIGFTSTGGSGFSTTVNTSMSGSESRIRNWAKSKGVWQLVLTGRPQDDFDLVNTFFLNVGGKGDGFRLYWALDHKGTAQFLGTGNGVKKDFQLQKTYSVGGRSYIRIINKPIMATVQDYQENFLTNTVVPYVDAAPKALGTEFTVDATTGVLSFITAPPDASTITADFEFHMPVRFDIEDMSGAQVLESNVLEEQGLITWSQVNMTEIRIKAGESDG